GRFVSPDWSESPGPIPYADTERPQTLNLYSYVVNNPTALVDLDGHKDDNDPDCGLICGIRKFFFKTEKEKEEEKEKLGQEAAKDEELLKQRGADPNVLAGLTNQQIVDLYNAIQRGDTSVETSGLKINIILFLPTTRDRLLQSAKDPKLRN